MAVFVVLPPPMTVPAALVLNILVSLALRAEKLSNTSHSNFLSLLGVQNFCKR
jgi:hypothetical protein